MSEDAVYLVVEYNMDGGYEVQRVYTDKAAARAFVLAYNNATYSGLEVLDMSVGAPAVDYDNPVYVGTWTARRKVKGEKQLVIVGADGFTTVVPNAVPAGGEYHYFEYFSGPTWRDLANPPEYEEPAVWIDNFHYSGEWHVGDTPPAAEVTERSSLEYRPRVVVRGTSKDAVEALLRATALEVRAELVGEEQTR